MKKLLFILLFIPFLLRGASPSFSDFNPSQFNTQGYQVSLINPVGQKLYLVDTNLGITIYTDPTGKMWLGLTGGAGSGGGGTNVQGPAWTIIDVPINGVGVLTNSSFQLAFTNTGPAYTLVDTPINGVGILTNNLRQLVLTNTGPSWEILDVPINGMAIITNNLRQLMLTNTGPAWTIVAGPGIIFETNANRELTISSSVSESGGRSSIWTNTGSLIYPLTNMPVLIASDTSTSGPVILSYRTKVSTDSGWTTYADSIFESKQQFSAVRSHLDLNAVASTNSSGIIITADASATGLGAAMEMRTNGIISFYADGDGEVEINKLTVRGAALIGSTNAISGINSQIIVNKIFDNFLPDPTTTTGYAFLDYSTINRTNFSYGSFQARPMFVGTNNYNSISIVKAVPDVNIGTGTITNFYNYNSVLSLTSGRVNNFYQMWLGGVSLLGGSVGTNYGLYVNSANNGNATVNWGIYQTGTGATNYLDAQLIANRGIILGSYAYGSIPSGPLLSQSIWCTDVLTSRGQGDIITWDGTSWRTRENIIAAPASQVNTFIINAFKVGLNVQTPLTTAFHSKTMTSASGVSFPATVATVGSASTALYAAPSSGSVVGLGAGGAVDSAVMTYGPVFPGITGWTYANSIQVSTDALATPAAYYWATVGCSVSPQLTNYPTSGVFFVYDPFKVNGSPVTGAATNNWIACVANSSSYTYTDTGLPMSTSFNAPNRLAVIFTQTSASFYTNGVLSTTISAAVAPNGMNPYSCKIYKCNSSTTSYLLISNPAWHIRSATNSVWP